MHGLRRVGPHLRYSYRCIHIRSTVGVMLRHIMCCIKRGVRAVGEGLVAMEVISAEEKREIINRIIEVLEE